MAASRRLPPAAPHRTSFRGVLPIVPVIMVCCLAIPTGVIGIALGLGALPLPYELFVVLRRLPVLFPLHMTASGVALILIPVAAFVRHRPALHRPLGRIAAAAVAAGGLSALAVALASTAPPGARAGFFAQGMVWLLLLAVAIAAIRRGERQRHACCMIAMASVASGAIWLRLCMAAANAAGLPFATTYGVASWACWLVPLGLVAASFIFRTEQAGTSHRNARPK